MAGIKETTELLRFGLVFGSHLAGATKDRKVSIFEGLALAKDLLGSGEALAGIGDVIDELKDLDGVESAVLIDIASTEFPFDSNATQQARVDSVKRFIPHLVTFIQEQRGVAQSSAQDITPVVRAEPAE